MFSIFCILFSFSAVITVSSAHRRSFRLSYITLSYAEQRFVGTRQLKGSANSNDNNLNLYLSYSSSKIFLGSFDGAKEEF